MTVTESVEGKRPWRREMIKECHVTVSSSNNDPDEDADADADSLDSCFLSNSIDFNVPDPLPDDDVSNHTWIKELESEMVSVVIQWKAEIIDQNGLRHSTGQNWVNLGDIFDVQTTQPIPHIPLRCYVTAPHRMEHGFAVPCKVNCVVTLENTGVSGGADLDVTLSFQQIFDAVAGLGQTGSDGFIWSGISEKRLLIVSHFQF